MKIRISHILAVMLFAQTAFAVLTGTDGLNDASRIVKCGSKYFWYSTGGGIQMRWTSAPETGVWYTGPDVFLTRPSWWGNYNPNYVAWAPDVIWNGGRNEYHMYYSVSTWGTNNSAIGLAVNSTLDPSDPDYQWVDKGIVISSHSGSEAYNAIDPCPVHTRMNEWFLAFGSYSDGLHLIKLNGEGYWHPTSTTIWNLASNPSSPSNQIEAPAIYPGTRNGVDGYWLFVNWGSGLGQGENATYNVRVGWSTNVRGPYLDKSGVDMWNGGGTLMMPSSQTFSWDGSTRIGRGHIGIITGENLDGVYPDWISYSYWLEGYGRRFGLQRLITDADGWPDDGIVHQH